MARSTLTRSMMAFLLLTFAYVCLGAEADTYAKFAKDLERRDGFFPILIDDKNGKVLVEIPRGRGEFIFQGSLPRGLGSNDIGLDRGQLGDTRLVVFERIGKRVLLKQLNTLYRAMSDNAAERASVAEAFAASVLFGFNVEFSDAERVVIDYTPFLLSDTHKVVRQLKQAKQGDFRLEPERSAPYLARTKAFPKNSELEAMLTFSSSEPGSEVVSVAPDPTSFTVHSHHSLIEAPPPGFQMRAYNPNSGYWAFDMIDFSQPIDRSPQRRTITRHRLEKKDPSAARSEAVEPIVYYLDPGAPEPVRSALLEGASWWNSAFEAIGFIDAFQVRMLPEDADPMDVRYNVIQWVHRSTRGWSYGSSVTDPRTGEIIKGHVTLGSLRDRQDVLIAQTLTSPFGAASEDASALTNMALARLRQLSAHEVGHTLGIAHNFAASLSNRGSVMDYPHPRIAAGGANGPTLADAYGVGLGPWDKFVIAYGYTPLSTEQESRALAAMLDTVQKSGLRFVTDEDSRSVESFNASGHLWDEGTNVLDAFAHSMAIRKAALTRFGAASIRNGTPWSELANVLVPLYYSQRYQTEATARLIGGVDFNYAVKGETLPLANKPVDGPTQLRAIDALLASIAPQTLALDPKLVQLIPPPAYGYNRTRESPPQRVGGALDPVTMAEAAAEHALLQMLAPARLARLQQQHSLDPAIADVSSLFERIVAQTIRAPRLTGLASEIQQRTDVLVVEHLLRSSYDEAAVPEVQAAARAACRDLLGWLGKAPATGASRAHHRYLADLIDKALADKKFERRKNVAQMPPGQPI